MRLGQEKAFAWTKKKVFVWGKKMYTFGPSKGIRLGQKMSFTYETKLNQYMLY